MTTVFEYPLEMTSVWILGRNELPLKVGKMLVLRTYKKQLQSILGEMPKIDMLQNK